MSDSNAKATWTPLEVRDLGGVAAAQGGPTAGTQEGTSYHVS